MRISTSGQPLDAQLEQLKAHALDQFHESRPAGEVGLADLQGAGEQGRCAVDRQIARTGDALAARLGAGRKLRQSRGHCRISLTSSRRYSP